MTDGTVIRDTDTDMSSPDEIPAEQLLWQASDLIDLVTQRLIQKLEVKHPEPPDEDLLKIHSFVCSVQFLVDAAAEKIG